MSTLSKTIRLSDTIDSFARRVHVNIRNGKVTMVYRWKDRHSSKAHTQRTTLTDNQAGILAGLLVQTANDAIAENKARQDDFIAGLSSQITKA